MASASIDFQLNRSELMAVLRSTQGPAAQAVMQTGNRVLNRARQLCPVDEGRLRGSLTLEIRMTVNGPIARIGSNLDYARYVHEGTGLFGPRHDYIRPVSASVLRWPAKNNSGSGPRRFSGGSTAGFVFSMRSKGTPPRPFLLDALRQVL